MSRETSGEDASITHLVVIDEDEHCLVVNKPVGILTHPSGPRARDADRPLTLEDLVRRHLRPDDPASAYVGTVHRLDKLVSGVMIWAKNARAARRLARHFETRQARKEYWAALDLSVSRTAINLCKEWIWDDTLARGAVPWRVEVVPSDIAGCQRAVTRGRVEEYAGLPIGLAFARLWPETGRTHQLRAQSAARGMPILGDVDYGSTTAFPAGIALHARRLTLPHPTRKTFESWVAPLPDAWRSAGIVLPETVI